MTASKNAGLVLPLEMVYAGDVAIAGGKGASLGEMLNNLRGAGVRVPGGFVITTNAYRHFIENAGIKGEIEMLLSQIKVNDIKALEQAGEKIRSTIKNARFPSDLRSEILDHYDEMAKLHGNGLSVAVRSSATTEDLSESSFAGQHESFLNIRDKDDLLNSVKRCFASLFTDRAISYRGDRGFNHFDAALAVVVQIMVRSDMGSSGVMFTLDTESGFENAVFITSTFGLGESIVQGAVNPDEYYVFKPTLEKGYRSIISKKLGTKHVKTVFSAYQTKTEPLQESERSQHSLTDDDILQLAKWAVIIERHYGKHMDIEWAKDGITGELFIVQARPETVHSAKKRQHSFETYRLKEQGKVIVTGKAVGSKIGQGEVNVIPDMEDMPKFRKGQVLVTEMTDPDWEPIMKIASAIVTNRGGRTAHAAIVSRELGIPCVIGTENATDVLKSEKHATVCCADGEEGKVYSGLLKYEVETIRAESIPKTKTKIMMNVGIPEKAFSYSMIPNDGVGLAREEFIINSCIGIHPLALLEFSRFEARAKSEPEAAKVIEDIKKRTAGYKNKADFFVDRLAQGIAVIAAAFYPKDVILRFSDFKSNEYANLIGGSLYEPKESNPMIGWRGASRYYDKTFMEAFRLECLAIKKAREEMGLMNIKPMVPFCRTPEEGRRVIRTMKELGLEQGKNGLEVYVMCEVPSNVIEADEFAKIFDGFSIGSNDLTQLSLGLDRDSELVSHLYDERSQTVKRLVKSLLETAKKYKRKVGICGQAPSDFPEFAQFLVENGIDSISLNADTVIKTRLMIAETEKRLGIS